jgi:hypothetical protein
MVEPPSNKEDIDSMDVNATKSRRNIKIYHMNLIKISEIGKSSCWMGVL